MQVSTLADLKKLKHEQAGGRWFKTLEDYVFDLYNGDFVRVPKGFKYDKASVPKLLWNIFPPFGDDTAAFLLHDWLYVHRGYIDALDGKFRPISRARADYLMFIYQCMLIGISSDKIFDKCLLKRLRIIGMYLGVRLGGWYYWPDTKFERILYFLFKKT